MVGGKVDVHDHSFGVADDDGGGPVLYVCRGMSGQVNKHLEVVSITAFDN